MSLGSRKMSFLAAKSNSDDLEFITKLAVEGKLKPVIDRSLHLMKPRKRFSILKRNMHGEK
jgi:NADPH:quinone reductase-like Zn-dependent oxidoreductase